MSADRTRQAASGRNILLRQPAGAFAVEAIQHGLKIGGVVRIEVAARAVVLKSARASAHSKPSAEKHAGRFRNDDLWHAEFAAKIGGMQRPGAAKATSENDRGSSPRDTETTRRIRIICALTMAMMPAAASISDNPSGSAMFFSMTSIARSRSRLASPPTK